MKANTSCVWKVLFVGALVAVAGLLQASADEVTPAPTVKPAKTYTGTVVSVNPQERALKVKGPLFSKSFSLGDSCSYTFLGNRSGAATDLRPGQKVTVGYQNASGVLIANRVAQHAIQFAGTVKAIDPQKHLLTVHVRGADKTFQLPGDCRVRLRNDKSGALADVQPGHHVTVTYEIPNNTPTAREIVQTSALFTGTLTAIDLTDRTVKSQAVFSSKTFHVADGCVIALKGETDAELRDLKPGDKLTFSFDEVNGVNIANRIADATGSVEAQTAETK